MPVQQDRGGVTGVGGGHGTRPHNGGLCRWLWCRERQHDVRQVLDSVHILKSSGLPQSIYNTFTQLDEEEEEWEEQVVEIYPARGAAAQWTAFLGSNLMENILESKMYFNKDFNGSSMSEVLIHFAAALEIKSFNWTKSVRRLQLVHNAAARVLTRTIPSSILQHQRIFFLLLRVRWEDRYHSHIYRYEATSRSQLA